MRDPHLKCIGKDLDYNPDVGIFTWMSSNRRCKEGETAGSLNKANGYIYVKFNNKRYLAHRLAWFISTGKWPKKHLDHINNDKSDNRIENLRECTPRENHHNRVDNSEYVGVRKQKNRFRAEMKINGKTTHLGSFLTAEEARDVYEKKWKELG